ncbi:MAG TPA: endonuclease/exonuclease/phosphatase family protein [Gammaproteobacteria bacterium]
MRMVAACFLFFFFTASACAAETLLASWNLKRLGHQPAKDLAVVVAVLSDYDIIALQEVMRPERVPFLLSAIEKVSKADWAHQCSHTIGRNSYKEAYCFIWRTDRVSYDSASLVYLDPGDVFAREPYSAVFRDADGDAFLLATVHVVYGDSKSDRRREGAALRGYWDFLNGAFPGVPVILTGDFNLHPDDESLAALREVARSLINEGGTTLSSIEGRYANLYDHIWVGADITPVEWGIRKIPVEFGLSHEYTRRNVSDHVPVWVRFSVGE